MRILCRSLAVVLLTAAAFAQSPPAAPASITAQVTVNPFASKPVNVHIQARHAEGWYPGATPRLVADRQSWLAHLFNRQRRFHVEIAAPPAGVQGCHGADCVFSDNWIHNLRTTGGADWQAAVMGNNGSQPAAAAYFALSNNGVAPAAGDCAAGSSTCTLSGEISSNGLARHVASYSHTNATNTFSDTYTWTATGSQSVQEAGWFDASSSGTMVFEAAFTQVNLISTDTFTATWTVTF